MAEATLVDMQLKEGQRLIDRLAQEGIAVTAAAWVMESECHDWYLYLATPLVSERGGRREAYHRVNEGILKMQEEAFGMNPLARKLIGSNDPMAKYLQAELEGRPSHLPT